jgi:hypothetical protein
MSLLSLTRSYTQLYPQQNPECRSHRMKVMTSGGIVWNKWVTGSLLKSVIWKRKVIWVNDSHGRELYFFAVNALYRNSSYVGNEIQHARCFYFYAIIFPNCVICHLQVRGNEYYSFLALFVRLCFPGKIIPAGVPRAPSPTSDTHFQ